MTVFSQRDAEQYVATGRKEFRHGRDMLVTPIARDTLLEAGVKVVFDGNAPAPAAAPAPAKAAAPTEAAALFHSAEAEKLKAEIVEMGRRCWLREYNDGNGGNISARIGKYFLCTPTGVSKGFMKPEMVCLVDADGNQVAGNEPWRRTSEILSHLGIYRSVPSAMAVVHAHPPHATAFAMAGIQPPQCLIPEVEVFVGTIPLAPYKTPGSQDMSALLGELAPKHPSIMMGNHGVISWGTSVEDAYFKMEITDAYCRMLWIAGSLPTKRTTIPAHEMKLLLDLKQKLGIPDERVGQPAAELCACDPWQEIADRPQACATPARAPEPQTGAEVEALVRAITDQVMAKLKS